MDHSNRDGEMTTLTRPVPKGGIGETAPPPPIPIRPAPAPPVALPAMARP